MSFHEKSRWIGLFANLLVWGWYFTQVFAVLRADVPAEAERFAGIGLTVVVIIWTVIIQVVATSAIAIHRPYEANAAPDERERAIARHAGARAYTLLSLGLVVAIGGSYTGWSLFATVNAVLFAFIIAECARYVIEIAAFRRGLA